MRRTLCLALVVLAAAPAAAQAVPYLSAGEAARVVGRALHREWNNIQRGSLDARCPATRQPNFRRCYYTYFTEGGDCWWGDMGIRELPSRYVYRILYDDRCH